MTTKLDELETWHCLETGHDVCRFDQVAEVVQSLLDENTALAELISDYRIQLGIADERFEQHD